MRTCKPIIRLIMARGRRNSLGISCAPLLSLTVRCRGRLHQCVLRPRQARAPELGRYASGARRSAPALFLPAARMIRAAQHMRRTCKSLPAAQAAHRNRSSSIPPAGKTSRSCGTSASSAFFLLTHNYAFERTFASCACSAPQGVVRHSHHHDRNV